MGLEVGRTQLGSEAEALAKISRNILTKHYVSNKDESLRLFNNKHLERLTKVHPITPLVIFCPVVAYFLWQSISVFSVSFFETLAPSLGGLLSWTFFEYVVHRFIFHFEPRQEGLLKKLHFLVHGIHHAYPKDSRRLVMPPSVSVPLALLLYFVAAKVCPERVLPAFLAGFFLGYLCYDMMHFAIHHYSFSNKTWQKIRRHHYLHHYSDKKNGFGVSSPLWDYIFRT